MELTIHNILYLLFSEFVWVNIGLISGVTSNMIRISIKKDKYNTNDNKESTDDNLSTFNILRMFIYTLLCGIISGSIAFLLKTSPFWERFGICIVINSVLMILPAIYEKVFKNNKKKLNNK